MPNRQTHSPKDASNKPSDQGSRSSDRPSSSSPRQQSQSNKQDVSAKKRDEDTQRSDKNRDEEPWSNNFEDDNVRNFGPRRDFDEYRDSDFQYGDSESNDEYEDIFTNRRNFSDPNEDSGGKEGPGSGRRPR